MANFLQDYMQGYQSGNAMVDNTRNMIQQTQVRKLAPDIVAGDPNAYAQAAAIDPKKATTFQQSGDNIALRTRDAAKYLSSALESGDQNKIAYARQTIKPFMDTLHPHASYPLDMDPTEEKNNIDAFIASTAHLDPLLKKGGMPSEVAAFEQFTKGLSAEDKLKAQRVHLGLDSRAPSAAMKTFNVIDPNTHQKITVQWDPVTGETQTIGGGASWRPGDSQPAFGQYSQPSPTNVQNRTNASSTVDGSSDPRVQEAIKLANEETKQGLPDDEVEKRLQERIMRIGEDGKFVVSDLPSSTQSSNIPQNATSTQNGSQLASPSNPFVGASPEAIKGAEEAAQQQAQVQYLPQRKAIETQYEAQQKQNAVDIENKGKIDAVKLENQYNAQQTLAQIAEVRKNLVNAPAGLIDQFKVGVSHAAGVDSELAKAGHNLITLGNWLTTNVPRMQGPQSDADVKMYKAMAADVGNSDLTRGERMSALDILEKIQRRYANPDAYFDPDWPQGGIPPWGKQPKPANWDATRPQGASTTQTVAPTGGIRKYNPATGRLE